MISRFRIAAITLALLAATLTVGNAAAELDMEAILAPVIALEARIPEDSRSAATLGTVRGGTGVIIDGAGLVVTVGYLIMEAGEVDLLPDGLGGGRIPADVVAWDQATGLGLIRARRSLGIPPIPLGESSVLRTGDGVITASWERMAGMYPAVVVERRTYTGYWEYLLDDAIFVAPVHPAFPGAALIDLQGRLAGVGGFALTDEVDGDEVFGTVFIPIDTLKSVLAELLLDGRSSQNRPWLGLYCDEFDDGLRVRRVPSYGPAARAGVNVGDRLVSVNGAPVSTLERFYRKVWSSVRPGEQISLELERDAKTIEVNVEASDRYMLLRLNHLSQ